MEAGQPGSSEAAIMAGSQAVGGVLEDTLQQAGSTAAAGGGKGGTTCGTHTHNTLASKNTDGL